MMDPPRRKISRLQQHDYTAKRIYFVTICTYQKHPYFGIIRNDEVEFGQMGRIVEEVWLALPESLPGVRVDLHVVMPNHLHGLIRLANEELCPTSLGAVIRQFKSIATKRIRKDCHDPEAIVWHRNYYEHIVRNADDLARIRKYIRDNPTNWDEDEYSPRNEAGRQETRSNIHSTQPNTS